MLRFLSIRNLAVIDRLEVEFEPGLSVLTGETGAGKSILVGAVGLLAGGRATSDLVRTGEELATVEAIFESADGDELIVRREITAQGGRSRAFVNGALTTFAALRELAAPLVDLHGQHEHQVLLDPTSHLDLLDAFAGLTDAREPVAEAFAFWQRLKAERAALLTGEREKAARAEFLTFQLQEIDRLAPRAGEDDELAAVRQVLANADRLQRLCADAYTSLYEGDQAALPALGTVWRKLGELAGIDDRFRPYVDARDGVKAQLEDLAFFLRSYTESIDASPARLQEVEDRLAVLDRLKRKHGGSLSEVLEKAASLRRRAGRARARHGTGGDTRRRGGRCPRCLSPPRRNAVRGTASCRRALLPHARGVSGRVGDVPHAVRSAICGRSWRGRVDRSRSRRRRILHLAKCR